jgi:hypothetical protein
LSVFQEHDADYTELLVGRNQQLGTGGALRQRLGEGTTLPARDLRR